jgi:hypothetical protein
MVQALPPDAAEKALVHGVRARCEDTIAFLGLLRLGYPASGRHRPVPCKSDRPVVPHTADAAIVSHSMLSMLAQQAFTVAQFAAIAAASSPGPASETAA